MAIKRILITGNSGFFGQQLSAYLAREEPDLIVQGFDRAYNQDLRDTVAVREAVKACDYVFHMGALTHVHQSIESPRPFIDTNVGGTLNVLEACREFEVPLTQISSSEYYGSSQCEPLPQAESHPCAPHSPYGASKAAQDRLCYAWRQTYGLDVRIVRPFNQFGPGQDVRKVIPRFMYLMLQGKPMTVHGDGEGSRDYVWIQDTVAGIWKSQFAPAGTALNLGTGYTWTTNQVAEIIREEGEKLGVTSFAGVTHVGSYNEARWGHVFCLRGSFALADTLIGWHPTVAFRDGIRKTWQWLLGQGANFYRGGEVQDAIASGNAWEDPEMAGQRPAWTAP